MQFKKILMVGAITAYLSNPVPAHAYSICPFTWVCFFQDPVSMAVGFLAREWNRHTEPIHYDIKEGLEKIKENIGMYQKDGKCGISATGQTGCDLATEEEGAAMAAEQEAAEAAAVMDKHTIEIIAQSEASGDYKYDASDEQARNRDGVAKTGDTFDQVREYVGVYMFATDDESVNADCTCAGGKKGNECDASECAQERQNRTLVVSSTAASSTADTYLAQVNENYNRLDKLVEKVNEAETIADFVGGLGELSVYASSAAVEQMILQTYDLRTQSYRNLVSSGYQKIDLSTLTKQEGNK